VCSRSSASCRAATSSSSRPPDTSGRRAPEQLTTPADHATEELTPQDGPRHHFHRCRVRGQRVRPELVGRPQPRRAREPGPAERPFCVPADHRRLRHRPVKPPLAVRRTSMTVSRRFSASTPVAVALTANGHRAQVPAYPVHVATGAISKKAPAPLTRDSPVLSMEAVAERACRPGAFKRLPGCRRTSSRAIGIRSCCFRRACA
jgi:hypothetical protein